MTDAIERWMNAMEAFHGKRPERPKSCGGGWYRIGIHRGYRKSNFEEMAGVLEFRLRQRMGGE